MVTSPITKLSQDYLAAFNSHDLERFLSFYTDDSLVEDIGLGKTYRGLDEIRKSYTDFIKGFPDVRMEFKSDFRVGDWGANEWVMTGTNKGNLPAMGNMPEVPATNKKITLRGATITQTKGDKTMREANYWNMGSFMQQLGLMQPMGGEEDRTPG
jgi:steroid delta-isomerase-like uncharacterized protein